MPWIASVQELTQDEAIAVDSKQPRRSHNASAGKAAIHMVSAWATHNGLVLGQRKVDAMGCQTKIAETIVEQSWHQK